MDIYRPGGIVATINAIGMRIRLLKKLAFRMNGVDVSRSAVGDILEVDEGRAALMVASGWAELVEDVSTLRQPPSPGPSGRSD